MRQALAEWIWRLAMLAGMLWVGWELHSLRDDLAQPPPDDAVQTAGADSMEQNIDEIRTAVAELAEKVDALAAAIVQRLK
jgi:hypothetical protein